MSNTTDNLQQLLLHPPVHNKEKLNKQQAYYNRLLKNGTAKKETYNLKPAVSAI